MKKETKKTDLSFDREEHKTGITDAFRAFGGMFKALFSKQKDNEMLNDLNIKKGFLPGLRYLLYLGFVLPFKIVGWVLTPRWAWVHFVQRHLISPMFEVDAISGEESPSKLLGTIYEKNINHFKSIRDANVEHSSLKPELSSLERIVIFAKIRVVMTLLVFAAAAEAVYELFDALIIQTGLLAALLGGFGFFAGSGGFGGTSDSVGAIATMLIFNYLPIFILSAYIAYILIFALRFVVEGAKSLMYADSQMLKDFVDDTLHYTIAKTMDLYEKEYPGLALQAYDLVLENVVIERERYIKDEPFYKRLEKKEEENIFSKNKSLEIMDDADADDAIEDILDEDKGYDEYEDYDDDGDLEKIMKKR